MPQQLEGDPNLAASQQVSPEGEAMIAKGDLRKYKKN